ncbi:MAG: hypothetical protein JRF63_01750 [Deltaproteobacteria bacterium]|nr:hypothetical protein [Deltaproteobacteria bacterium]
MSEQLSVCKALAAMMTKGGDANEAEITFVGNAAMELGLSPEENEDVMKALKEGGDFAAELGNITSRRMRTFLFRRVVAATLLDDQVEDEELALIHEAAKSFDFKADVVDEYLAWMKEGIAWEKRGVELMAKL